MHFAAAAADDATNELPNVAAASAAASAAADLALHSIAEALLGNFSSRSPHAKVTRKSSSAPGSAPPPPLSLNASILCRGRDLQ